MERDTTTSSYTYFPVKKYSADAWIRRVVARIYRITQSFWEFRCEFVQGVESVLTSKRERKALKKKIKKQFQLGPNGVRGTDKHLFIPVAICHFVYDNT